MTDGSGVLVVGQLARDLALRVDELPDAGGSTRVLERREMLGGKGANQAVGLHQLGTERVVVLGVLGRDVAGEAALAQAAADGLDVRHVVRRGRTALLVDVVEAEGRRRLLEDVPTSALLTGDDVSTAASAGVLEGVDTVCLQLQQPADSMVLAAQLADEAGARVVLDGAVRGGVGRQLLRLAHVARLDATEAHLSTDVEVTTWADAHVVAERLLGQGPELVAVAVPDHGDLVAWPYGEERLPHGDGPVVDPTGAGDAFLAGLVTALRRGASPAEAGRCANACAASLVRRLGGRPDLSPHEHPAPGDRDGGAAP